MLPLLHAVAAPIASAAHGRGAVTQLVAPGASPGGAQPSIGGVGLCLGQLSCGWLRCNLPALAWCSCGKGGNGPNATTIASASRNLTALVKGRVGDRVHSPSIGLTPDRIGVLRLRSAWRRQRLLCQVLVRRRGQWLLVCRLPGARKAVPL